MCKSPCVARLENYFRSVKEKCPASANSGTVLHRSRCKVILISLKSDTEKTNAFVGFRVFFLVFQYNTNFRISSAFTAGIYEA